MPTGDGLLARFHPRFGLLTPAQLSGIADAAQASGNGLIEVTSRGNLQIRGLSEPTRVQFASTIASLGFEIDSTPEIRIPPSAALRDGSGRALRHMADALEAAIADMSPAPSLAPKFAIVVDRVDNPELASLSADIRLSQRDETDDLWDVSVAGQSHSVRGVGTQDKDSAIGLTLALVQRASDLGGARGRDLTARDIAEAVDTFAPPARAAEVSTGAVLSGSLAEDERMQFLGLAFGQIHAADLKRFCSNLPIETRLCLAPARGIIVARIAMNDWASMLQLAEDCGLVTHPDDFRLKINACAGAPSCASAHLATHALGEALADMRPPAVEKFYLAGCEKQCARPSTPHVAVVATAAGIEIVSSVTALPKADLDRINALARRYLRPRSATA